MAIKFGHRLQTAVAYGFALLMLTFIALNVAITGINIMSGSTVFDPIGLPLFAGGIMFFLAFALASSENMDSKAVEK